MAILHRGRVSIEVCSEFSEIQSWIAIRSRDSQLSLWLYGFNVVVSNGRQYHVFADVKKTVFI